MSNSAMIRLFFLLLVVLTASCVSSPGVVREEGLVTGQPGMNTFPAGQPGETERLQRPYSMAPPLIPHHIGEFVINRSFNECLDCHLEGTEADEAGHGAPGVPPSHFVNEYKKEERKERVTGTRYLCLQCHVQQSEETPPVSYR